ncbi:MULTISPECIES: hypothetical protein [unclassified Bradyrhizobium]|uniref:hypothetical protein n=1 Tax=unclassified Bradyrhizobium TaxID=2631580 RepID=UPI001409B362
MNPSASYMHATATHPATVKATSAAAESAASSTTGIGIIGKHADSNEKQNCRSGEDPTKHGAPFL